MGINYTLVANLTETLTLNNELDYTIENSLNVTQTLTYKFDYVLNATLNLSSDINVGGAIEADYYIDDGGFWIGGKI